jgi:hypothetical protein
MKDRTRKLLDTIENAHDWEEGQVYSGGGTQLSSTDTCRICGLPAHKPAAECMLRVLEAALEAAFAKARGK